MKNTSAVLFLALGLAWANAEAEDTTAPADATPMTAPAQNLTAEASVGTGIENRELVGAADSFSADVGQVVGWSRILGANQPTEVRHVWSLNGEEVSSVPLNVQSASFRTYSRKTLYGRTGSWTFEVKDTEGKVLASKSFEVTPGSAPAATDSAAPATGGTSSPK